MSPRHPAFRHPEPGKVAGAGPAPGSAPARTPTAGPIINAPRARRARATSQGDPSSLGPPFLRLLFALALLLTLTACHAPAPKPDSRTYTAHGTIQQISADHHLATIQHDAIPGFMPAMTMDYSVRDARLLDGLNRGDQITFTLAVNNEDAWITAAQRTGHTDLPAPAPTASAPPEPQPGDLLPDADFIAEDGRPIHLSDFRGKVVILTFFFTRCPLPNFCPLMNRNFAEARQLLLNDPSAPKNWQFLSISFDPQFDTPSALASYADSYRAHNPDRWLFAAATPDTLAHFAAPLGLIVMRSGDSISHNLRTLVVDPQGRLARQFNDNLWTPDQLKQAILAAAPN